MVAFCVIASSCAERRSSTDLHIILFPSLDKASSPVGTSFRGRIVGVEVASVETVLSKNFNSANTSL